MKTNQLTMHKAKVAEEKHHGYNNIYLLQLGCYPVAVVILHVNKT